MNQYSPSNLQTPTNKRMLYDQIRFIVLHLRTAVPCPRIQSPLKTEPSSSNSNATWSSLCPGVATTLRVTPSSLMTSPSDRWLIGTGEEKKELSDRFEKGECGSLETFGKGSGIKRKGNSKWIYNYLHDCGRKLC